MNKYLRILKKGLTVREYVSTTIAVDVKNPRHFDNIRGVNPNNVMLFGVGSNLPSECALYANNAKSIKVIDAPLEAQNSPSKQPTYEDHIKAFLNAMNDTEGKTKAQAVQDAIFGDAVFKLPKGWETD